MKKKPLTQEQCDRIWFMYNWHMAIMDYTENLAPESEKQDWRQYFEEPKMTKNDLEGWQMAYNDIMEEVQGLTPEQYKELDKILIGKFGQGLFEADQKHVNRILKIVTKNKISNEEQYYLLREYFERIWDMPEHKETANKIETMLFTFDEKEAKKQAKAKKESVVAEPAADYVKSIKLDDQ